MTTRRTRLYGQVFKSSWATFRGSAVSKRRLRQRRSTTIKSPLKIDIAAEGLRVQSLGAILSELDDLQQKVDHHEEWILHSLQPAASKMAVHLEHMREVAKQPVLVETPDAIATKVSSIVESTDALARQSDDLHDRLSFYTLLQRQLRELIDLARDQHYRDFRAAGGYVKSCVNKIRRRPSPALWL